MGGAGTWATFVPEMDMFFNAGTVGNASNLDKVTLATGEQSLVQLLDSLYVGCRVKVESGSTTTFTLSETVNSPQEIIVSVVELLHSGIPPEDLEIALEDKMEEFEDDIVSVDYILNIRKISTDIQSTTDETLRNL